MSQSIRFSSMLASSHTCLLYLLVLLPYGIFFLLQVDPMLHKKTAECNMVLDESKTCDRRRQKETLVGTLVLVLCFHVKKKKTNVNLQVVFINMLTLSLYKRV